MGRALNVRLQFAQGLFCAAHHREVGQGLRQRIVGIAFCTVWRYQPQGQLCMLVGAGIKLLGR